MSASNTKVSSPKECDKDPIGKALSASWRSLSSATESGGGNLLSYNEQQSHAIRFSFGTISKLVIGPLVNLSGISLERFHV